MIAARIDPHPTDCQCSDCMSGHTEWTNSQFQVSSFKFQDSRAGAAPGSKLLTPNSKFEAEIITSARPVVVNEILALLGKDIPDPVAHARYLDSLAFSDLCARRDQLLTENQERLKQAELRRQPELPMRSLRQPRFFYGRQS